MPTRSRVRVCGESDERYRYEVYDLEDDFPERVGNYIFARIDPRNDRWIALYAGETGNFDCRLTSTNDAKHLLAIEEYGATHILVHQNGKQKQGRLDEEADIVANYNPPCNG